MLYGTDIFSKLLLLYDQYNNGSIILYFRPQIINNACQIDLQIFLFSDLYYSCGTIIFPTILDRIKKITFVSKTV